MFLFDKAKKERERREDKVIASPKRIAKVVEKNKSIAHQKQSTLSRRKKKAGQVLSKAHRHNLEQQVTQFHPRKKKKMREGLTNNKLPRCGVALNGRPLVLIGGEGQQVGLHSPKPSLSLRFHRYKRF